MKILRNEKGSTFVLVMMILIVFTVLSTCLLLLLGKSFDSTVVNRKEQSAYYIAEAALRNEIKEIDDEILASKALSKDAATFFTNLDLSIIGDGTPKEYTNFDEQYGDNPKASIEVIKRKETIEPNRTTVDYLIKSTGYFSDGSQKTVINTYTITYERRFTISPNYAIFSEEEISLTNGPKVVGPIGTKYLDMGAVTALGGVVIEGKVYVDDDDFINVGAYEECIFTKKIAEEHNKKEYEEKAKNPSYEMNLVECQVVEEAPKEVYPKVKLPELPSENMITVDDIVVPYYEGYYYMPSKTWDISSLADKIVDNVINVSMDTLSCDQNTTIIIQIPKDTTVNLVVNKCILKNGRLEIENNQGGGKLNLYLPKSGIIELGSNMYINVPDGKTNDQLTNADSDLNLVTKIKNAVEKVNIYYYGTNPIKTDGASSLCCNLFIQEANCELASGSRVFGNVICGGSKLNANGGIAALSKLIYAPNAEVNVDAGARIVGGIISKSCSMTGGTSVTIDPDLVVEVPLEEGLDTVSKVKSSIKEL